MLSRNYWGRFPRDPDTQIARVFLGIWISGPVSAHTDSLVCIVLAFIAVMRRRIAGFPLVLLCLILSVLCGVNGFRGKVGLLLIRPRQLCNAFFD